MMSDPMTAESFPFMRKAFLNAAREMVCFFKEIDKNAAPRAGAGGNDGFTDIFNIGRHSNGAIGAQQGSVAGRIAGAFL